jgi:hypothetical protein
MSPTPDVERLLALFDAGTLVRPDAAAPNTVHLGRALAAVAGAPRFAEEPGVEPLVALIGEPAHLVFVLADGLGMNLEERLPEESFLRRHLAMSLQAVFPSSTAPALTSLATGVWPATHAVPTWFTFLPERGITGVLLPYADRASRLDLNSLGVGAETAFPIATQPGYFSREYRAFQPRAISGSVYTRYVNGRKAAGYASMEHGVNAVLAGLARTARKTYSYLYVPDVDNAEHDHGVTSEEVWRRLLRLDTELGRLKETAGDEVRLVVSADHGQITVPDSEKHQLALRDDLSSMLRVWPPAGEPRLTSFHVAEGQRSRFVDAFQERFGDAFLLLSADEAESLRLFGPGVLSPRARGRIGDFIAIPAGRGAITYAGEPGVHAMKGMHGGLLPEEMHIPLVIA